MIKIKRILGTISDEIIKQWGLDDYKDKKIIIYPDAKEHSEEKHKTQYENEEEYYFVMDSLENIIKNPDYVYYDKNKKGLEYFKKFKNNVMVAVRVNEGKELKVKSVYPVTEIKITNRKKKEEMLKMQPLIEKYRYKDEFEIQC